MMTVKMPRFSFVIVLSCLFVFAVAAEAAPTQCALPEGTRIDPDSLRASANLRHVLFLEPGAAAKGKSESISKLFPSAYWLLDTQTGKLTNVLDLLPVTEGEGKLLVKPCGLSANGRHALILAERIKQSEAKSQRKKGYTAFLMTLASGSVEKIGEEIVYAAWVGDTIALSRFSGGDQDDGEGDEGDEGDGDDESEEGDTEEMTLADSQTEPVSKGNDKKSKRQKTKIPEEDEDTESADDDDDGKGRRTEKMMFLDPITKSTTELEMRGIIICGHPGGTLVVFGCNLEDLTKATKIRALRSANMAVINVQGDVLREFDVKPLKGAAPSRPILSDNGKYVAFRQGRLARGRAPKKVEVRIIATTGDEEQTIEEVGTPIGLTDDGRVITVGNVFEVEGAPVKVWDRELNSRTVLDHVAAATLVGDQVFYLTCDESPLVKSMKLEF